MSLLLLTSVLSLSACDLAPEFKLPETDAPTAFKGDTSDTTPTVEPASDGKWKRVDDKARIVEFAWWRMFKDEKLDALMETAMKDNPTLEVALNRVNSARAAAGLKEADLYPSIEAGIGPERSRSAEASVKANAPGATPHIKPHTFYRANGTITYEVDLFGRNRNLARAAGFAATGEEDNYLAARLSLQAEIAETYFRLAALTKENELLTRTLTTREESLKLTREKYEVGAVDGLVVASSEAELAKVQEDAAAIADAKANAEHALLVLVGKPPAEAVPEVNALTMAPPTVPAGLPSSLLERRPDIKRAVETMKAANARIGVARTGYFPQISLSAMGGFVSSDLKDLFNWSSRTWAIGPMAGTVLTQPIFEGGRVAAARAQSDADYNAAAASYRQAVLAAFREVEDGLSGMEASEQRMKAVDSGFDAATRAYKIADARFKAGYSNYLEFLDAERNRLAADRAQIQLRGEQYITTIELVKALGGSWDAPHAPATTGEVPSAEKPEQVPADVPETAAPAPAPEEKSEGEKPWYDLDWMPKL